MYFNPRPLLALLPAPTRLPARSAAHTGHGLPNVEALRLLRRLLAWDPAARISAAEAARHPFFSAAGAAATADDATAADAEG